MLTAHMHVPMHMYVIHKGILGSVLLIKVFVLIGQVIASTNQRCVTTAKYA